MDDMSIIIIIDYDMFTNCTQNFVDDVYFVNVAV